MSAFFLTSLAVIAFAANSVLCRLALADGNIDPASFTVIRLLSGAVVLAMIMQWRSSKLWSVGQVFLKPNIHHWLGAMALFVYAVCFSFAYIDLNTATGALILFATVQIGLLVAHVVQGNQLKLLEIVGAMTAVVGFGYLMLPNATTPDYMSASLMMIAGLGWIGYTLVGKKQSEPIKNTAESFLRCLPFCVILALIYWPSISWNNDGILLALLSGAIASGLGYVIWYQALRMIKLTTAAVSQLCAPVVAGVGGAVLVGETVSFELILAGSLIVIGIGLIVSAKN